MCVYVCVCVCVCVCVLCVVCVCMCVVCVVCVLCVYVLCVCALVCKGISCEWFNAQSTAPYTQVRLRVEHMPVCADVVVHWEKMW